MRRLIQTACLLLLLVGMSHAACSSPCIQAIYARGTSPLSQAITLTTSGNMFHVWTCNGSGGGAPTIASSPVLTFTAASGDDGFCKTVFTANVTTVQSYTITATGGAPLMIISEWTNLPASPFDISAASGSFVNGTSWHSANATTAQNNELFIGGVFCSAATNCVIAASGWTTALDDQDAGNGTDTVLFFKTTNTAGANNITGTATTGVANGSFDAFKLNAAGGLAQINLFMPFD